jgi:hypothetical protein
MRTDQPKPDHEGAFIAFMLAFWPLLLILGLVNHFGLPESDLRLFTLALAGAAGWGCVRVQQRRTARVLAAEDRR